MVVVVVHGEGNIVIGRGDGQVAGRGCLCDRGFVIDDIDNKTAIVKGNAVLQQVLDHLVGDGLFAQVVEDELHGRVVGKAAILLVEAEEGGMQMDGERGRAAAKLAQNVVGRPDKRFRDGLERRVAPCRMCVGARAQAAAQAGSRAAHGMSGLYCRRRRHAECWRYSLPLCSKNRWLVEVLGAWVKCSCDVIGSPVWGHVDSRPPSPPFPFGAVDVMLSHDSPYLQGQGPYLQLSRHTSLSCGLKMAEIAAGALVAEQVVSTTLEGGAIAGYAVAKPTVPLKATFSQIATADKDDTRYAYTALSLKLYTADEFIV